MSKSIVLFGAGGHAKAIIDTVEKEGRHSIAGLLDGNKPPGQSVYGYEVLGDDCWLLKHGGSIDGAIVAIGDNWTRAAVTEQLLRLYPSLPFSTAIHPSAQIARGARIGAGSVVMAGAVLGSDAEMGGHNVIYPLVNVDHDSRTGPFVSFAPRSVSGGDVRIGAYSAIGIGATLIHGITVGEHSVIGAGATVVSDIPSYTVAYGTPAKPIRTRKQGERYL
ncbi:acetyltransferase [Paenibacillus sp. GCM10027627]|uniref:acetyltransferase n=1 Tax=unclassified Paenibacillus TaxID=185978 RepID=UPI0036310406